MNSNIGCITEQGSMGLGFTPVSDDEIYKLKDDLKKEWNNDKEKNNTSQNSDIDH